MDVLTSGFRMLNCAFVQSSRRKGGRKKATAGGTAACCAGLREALSPRLFKALGDPNRVALLARLADCRGPRSAEGGFDVIYSSGVLHHLSDPARGLALLRDAGVLQAERRGKQVFYAVRAAALADTLRTLADLLAACVAGACDAERKEPDVRK